MKIDSELEIHAFVDGELSAEQQAEVLEAMQHDTELARQVCEINNSKAQLKLAYASPPGLKTAHTMSSRRHSSLVASVAVLAIGLFGGWLLHSQTSEINHSNASSDRFVMLDGLGLGQAPAIEENSETRIVFHLTNPEQTLASELLDDVDAMLKAYAEEGKQLRVEIVSNGKGLAMLRERLSNNKERIAEMAAQHDNLTFVACKNTIDRIQVIDGIEV